MITNNSKIQVIIRKRPLSDKEISANQKDAIKCEYPDKIILKEDKVKFNLEKYSKLSNFKFDRTFGENNDNEYIFNEEVTKLIDLTLNGRNSSLFAYGQTGSGKTYTMLGNGYQKGIIEMSIRSLLVKNNGLNKIFVSFYEIYCGKIFDLLNNRGSVTLLEDGKGQIKLKNLTKYQIETLEDLNKLMIKGSSYRITADTKCNSESSRSHAILNCELYSLNEVKDNNIFNNNGGKKEELKLYSKLSFIDLAGNEKGSDTFVNSKSSQIDGAEINKSLLALKECIRAIDLKSKHIPFRGSKLTMVLKENFGKECFSIMIACLNPCSKYVENSLNTLRYAERVKNFKQSINSELKSTAKKEIIEYSNNKIEASPINSNPLNYNNILGINTSTIKSNSSKRNNSISKLVKSNIKEILKSNNSKQNNESSDNEINVIKENNKINKWKKTKQNNDESLDLIFNNKTTIDSNSNNLTSINNNKVNNSYNNSKQKKSNSKNKINVKDLVALENSIILKQFNDLKLESKINSKIKLLIHNKNDINIKVFMDELKLLLIEKNNEINKSIDNIETFNLNIVNFELNN